MTQEDAGTGAQVKDKAAEVAGQAQEKAQQAAGQLRDQVDQRSTDAGKRISEQGSDLRSVSEQLREQGKDKPAQLADRAAEQVERVGSWLEHSDADRILHDVEDAARKNPWAVVAGGFILGVAASRFLKASSSDRYQSRGAGVTSGPRAGTGTSGQPPLPTLPGPADPVYRVPDHDRSSVGTIAAEPAVPAPGGASPVVTEGP